MKHNHKIALCAAIAALTLGMSGCADEKMEWGKDPSHGDVTVSELPLQLQEQIARYDALNTYTNFTLGVGIDRALYMGDETYRNTVNANFDEITVGYDMKHGAMVSGTGAVNFTNVDALVDKLKEAGLTVYGHTLVWHTNQNASYLNSLIAPQVIPGSAGSNLIVDGGFETDRAGFAGVYYDETVTVTTDEAVAGSQSLKVAVGSANSGGKYNMQLRSAPFQIITGHHYLISFFIKSDVPGQVGLDFEVNNLTNQYPYVNGVELAATGTAWTQVSIDAAGLEATADNNAMTFRLLLGAVADVNYYIDNVEVTDLDAPPTFVNLVTNSTFDADIDGWAKWNGGTDALSHETTEVYKGAGAMKVINASNGNEWDTQIHADFTGTLTAGASYKISFMIKSEAAGQMRCSTTGTTMHYQGAQTTSTTWKQVVWEFDGNGTETGLNFDIGKEAGTYYIDDVDVYDVAGAPATGPTIIEKLDEEKTQIIGDALENWISTMVGHYKGDVHAWDVVNEPMSDASPANLKTSSGADASDEFYWQDYLGKDYAVTAFNLARQYGNADDKLFINDYNLEQSLAKCDGLIAYVQYIEEKGATVDGIGTQMHLSLTSDKGNIEQMFQKLAATGKLIKVSELDIAIGSSPTPEQYAQQAELYQYVVDMYMEHVPEAQRYGITVWSVSDSEVEHEYWLKGENPCLWDANYARKHAYKGFANGLAGRDVSVDFPGDLQY
ncbi:hypothetical protein FACS189452_07540 [Bacteroidia bacterium]|nr:hypothetical protein FACS189452_07540 [Bacteroidia bacterium]